MSLAMREGRLKYSLCRVRMINVARNRSALARLSKTGLYSSCALAVDSKHANQPAGHMRGGLRCTIKSLPDPTCSKVVLSTESALIHPLPNLINPILTPHKPIEVPGDKLLERASLLLNAFLEGFKAMCEDGVC